MNLSIKGIENLKKVIDGLINEDYQMLISVDDFQMNFKSEERHFTVQICEISNGERFYLDSEFEPKFTLKEAKEILGIVDIEIEI
jgi:hypothetical protein